MKVVLAVIVVAIGIYNLHAKPLKLENKIALPEKMSTKEPPVLKPSKNSHEQSSEIEREEEYRDGIVVNKLDKIINWIEVKVNGKKEKIPSYKSTVKTPVDKGIISKFGTKEEMGAMENILAENSDKMDKISDKLVEGDVIMPGKKIKRNSVRDANLHWPNAEMPYLIDQSFDHEAQARILEGMEHFQEHTCIRLIPWTTQTDFIEIVPRSGCWSWVGKIGGIQQLSLGGTCTHSRGTIVHELMHAAGFHHEHTRTDRDDYVTIYFENIIAGQEYNFYMYSDWYIDPLGTHYDYASILHYPSDAWSANGLDTIVPKQSGATIGNRVNLSPTDIYKLNTLYKCGCKDSHIYCAYWASIGECQKNPRWMLPNCQLSCDQCFN